MEDMDNILNPPVEDKETTPVDESAESVETPIADEQEQATGETTQVAAETAAETTTAQVKAELAGLAKERERIRQKEAALDEERERLLAGKDQTASTQETSTEEKDPKAELKDLRKQYRKAFENSILEPDDEKVAQLVEELEDRMDEVRIQIQRGMTDQEKAAEEYSRVYSDVHDKYPFLDPKHPQANYDLNEDINTYYSGRIQKGDSKAVALSKAVNLFAPGYAKSMKIDTAIDDGGEAARTKKAEADKLIKEKLAKSGFSEVRSVGRTKAKTFSGPTPMASILGKT